MNVLVVSWFLAGIFVGAFLVVGLMVLFLRVKDKTPEQKARWIWTDWITPTQDALKWKTGSQKFAADPIVANEAHEKKVVLKAARENDETCPTCGMVGKPCQCDMDRDAERSEQEWR